MCSAHLGTERRRDRGGDRRRRSRLAITGTMSMTTPIVCAFCLCVCWSPGGWLHRATDPPASPAVFRRRRHTSIHTSMRACHPSPPSVDTPVSRNRTKSCLPSAEYIHHGVLEARAAIASGSGRSIEFRKGGVEMQRHGGCCFPFDFHQPGLSGTINRAITA